MSPRIVAAALLSFVLACDSGKPSTSVSPSASTAAPAATAGATASAAPSSTAVTATMKLESSNFSAGGSIPKRHTCEGDDVAPSLKWSGAPAGTKSFALIVDDPDAPDPAAPKRTWVHWVLYNIPAAADALPEGAKELPAGTQEGKNDWKSTGYGGPCPPIGRHRYFHKLYALDVLLKELSEPTKAQLEAAMKGHVLARGELIGTYQKSPK